MNLNRWPKARLSKAARLAALAEEWRPKTAITGYTEYKANGWPYCPRCDHDELYSDYSLPDGDTRTEAERMAEYVRCIVGCYHCGWHAPDLWRVKHE